MKAAAIVNPAAGRGDGVRLWSQALARFPHETKDLVTWTTECPGHAESLAARARREGFERLIVVGGDGTLFQVINGLWWEVGGRLPSVAMVPWGTGCDYVRNFRRGRAPADELLCAMRNPAKPVSVGMASLKGLDGRPIRRVFLNILGTGYDADIVMRMKRNRRPRLGKALYWIALLREMFDLKTYRLVGEVGGVTLEAESIMLVACLGRYFGGGMMIAPDASPLSVHFQVLWSTGAGRMGLIGLLPKVYRGRHLEHPIVRSCRAESLRLGSSPAAYVEAEGELVGTTPMEVEVMPAALQFVTS